MTLEVMGKPVNLFLMGGSLVFSHIKSFPQIHAKMHVDIPILSKWVIRLRNSKINILPWETHMLFLELIQQADSPALQWTEVKCSHYEPNAPLTLWSEPDLCEKEQKHMLETKNRGPGDREGMPASNSELRGRQDQGDFLVQKLCSVGFLQLQASVLATVRGPGSPGERWGRRGQERQREALRLSSSGGFLSLNAFSANFQFFFNERVLL